MTYELVGDWTLTPAQFKRVVEAFPSSEMAAELLTGLTIDAYSDLVSDESDDPLIITYYHALNPSEIES